MSKFEVGTRVGFDFDKINDYGKAVGTVTDVLSDGRVMVKWDETKYYSYNMAPYNAPINPDQLLTEDEKTEKVDRLEAEFNRVAEEVRGQLRSAGVLLESANKAAKDAGFDLHEMWEATREFERSMEKAGWNTSSLHC